MIIFLMQIVVFKTVSMKYKADFMNVSYALGSLSRVCVCVCVSACVSNLRRPPRLSNPD